MPPPSRTRVGSAFSLAAGSGRDGDGIDRGEDVEQLAFELDADLLLTNAQFVARQDSTPIDRPRGAIERRLAAAARATAAGRLG